MHVPQKPCVDSCTSITCEVPAWEGPEPQLVLISRPGMRREQGMMGKECEGGENQG